MVQNGPHYCVYNRIALDARIRVQACDACFEITRCSLVFGEKSSRRPCHHTVQKKNVSMEYRRSSAGEFSPCVPNDSDDLSSAEYRKRIRDSMLNAQQERKQKHGGRVGAAVSDHYIDELSASCKEHRNQRSSAADTKRYSMGNQDSWK